MVRPAQCRLGCVGAVLSGRCTKAPQHQSQRQQHQAEYMYKEDTLQTTQVRNNGSKGQFGPSPRALHAQEGRARTSKDEDGGLATGSFSFFSGRKIPEGDLSSALSVPAPLLITVNLTRSRRVAPLCPFTTALAPFRFDSAPPSWPSVRTADKQRSAGLAAPQSHLLHFLLRALLPGRIIGSRRPLVRVAGAPIKSWTSFLSAWALGRWRRHSYL